MGRYAEVHGRSLTDPDVFWAEAAEAIDWDQRWDKVLDDSRPPFIRWFTGGRLNTCHNALDRHVEGGRAPPRNAPCFQRLPSSWFPRPFRGAGNSPPSQDRRMRQNRRGFNCCWSE